MRADAQIIRNPLPGPLVEIERIASEDESNNSEIEIGPAETGAEFVS